MSDSISKLDTLAELVQQIQQTHQELSAQAAKAVNVSLTVRNWLIGLYIAEYEQQGRDRAQYGAGLLASLSTELQLLKIPRCDARELRRYRLFYQTYPQIRETLAPELSRRIPRLMNLGDTVSQIQTPDVQAAKIAGSFLISRLSFSHIAELLGLDHSQKRAFYEAEAIQGNWSVRELKRQIGSFYYERSGLSENKQKLSQLAHANADQNAGLNIRDPYILEFLGLKPTEVMSESHLKHQLLGKLQDFLLELKLARFSHANLGQLNSYVSWYQTNMMTEGDNPPIGILLCTDKNHALAEYALAGMDNQLFIAKYQLELAKIEEMQRFIDEQMKEVSS